MAQIPQDDPIPVRPAVPAPASAAAPASTTAKAGRAVRELVETLLLAALIFFAVRLVVLNFKVDGESMLPNLQNEEMLLVNRNAYKSIDFGGLLPGGNPADGQFYPFSPPERGDIIVFDPPLKNNRQSDKPYIKRIIGLPGERVTIGDQNGVYINGQLLDEPYIDEDTVCTGRREYCDMVVQPGNVFVLGDNRTNSSDSRVFGQVPVERIIGKAWFAYWPPAEAGMVAHYDYPNVPEVPSAVAIAATPVTDGERKQDRAERRRQRSLDEAATPQP